MGMNSDQLAVERAAWATALKQEFKAFPQFEYREHFNDYQTIFVVSQRDTPGWKANVTICSGHTRKNRWEVESIVVGYSGKTGTLHKVMNMVEASCAAYQKAVDGLKAKENAAAQWHERQNRELAGMALPGIDMEIVKNGPHAGKYEVRFLPGHPFERVTLDQLKEFYTLCCRISQKS